MSSLRGMKCNKNVEFGQFSKHNLGDEGREVKKKLENVCHVIYEWPLTFISPLFWSLCWQMWSYELVATLVQTQNHTFGCYCIATYHQFHNSGKWPYWIFIIYKMVLKYPHFSLNLFAQNMWFDKSLNAKLLGYWSWTLWYFVT